jgi:phytanoyl-CoA hydroxylase
MLTDEQIRQFHEQGYLKSGRLLGNDEVEQLRAEIERVIADRDKPVPQPVLLHNLTKKDDAVIWQIVNIWEASPAFAALVRHPLIAGEVAQLTGARQLRLWHDQIQYKLAEKGGVNMWHQDWPYWGILSAPHQVTAWVALDDVDAGNGCMSMVPGSHRWGNQIQFLHRLKDFGAMPAEFDGHRIEVKPCPVGQGEVHYHHALTWHGSHANTSDRPRRAIALHYMTDQTRFLASGAHVMKPFVTVPDGAQLEGEHFPLVWPR